MRFFAASSALIFFPADLASFKELLDAADEKLFNKINNTVEHLLHGLLPPPSVAPEHVWFP